jgi:hypothetical protein
MDVVPLVTGHPALHLRCVTPTCQISDPLTRRLLRGNVLCWQVSVILYACHRTLLERNGRVHVVVELVCWSHTRGVSNTAKKRPQES